MRRLLLPAGVVLLLNAGAASGPTDPWPNSPVLIRLFLQPSGRAAGERLARDLTLTAAQVDEMRRLARDEAAYGQAG